MPRAGAQLSLFKSRRQRGVAPPPAKEFSLHVMVADTLRRWCLPSWRWTHFPSGENRSAITGARLKRMGMQRGWPDFLLLSPERVHLLELKRKSEQLTDEQRALRDYCEQHGHPYAVVYTYDAALNQLREWGAVRTGIEVSV